MGQDKAYLISEEKKKKSDVNAIPYHLLQKDQCPASLPATGTREDKYSPSFTAEHNDDGREYLFGQFESAIPAVSFPNFLPIPH